MLHAVGIKGLLGFGFFSEKVFFSFFFFSVDEGRRNENSLSLCFSFFSNSACLTSISPLSLVITSSTRTSRCGVRSSRWSLSGYSSWSRACFFLFFFRFWGGKGFFF